jgi:Domain of unknown function (DUF4272)
MMKRYALLVLLPLLSCQGQQPAAPPVRDGVPVEHVIATKDQQARRAQSEAYCRAHGVPYYKNPTAMLTDSEVEAALRTQDQVVDRALALCLLGLKSEGMPAEQLATIDKAYHISAKLTPNERAYVTAPHPTEQQQTDANWRYEGLHVLLWALGYVPSLAYPDRLCAVASDVKIIHDLSETQFRAHARLRTKKELLDQADLILRLDWACTEARLKQQPAPGGLNSEVVVERHHALNWLITYGDQEWDDVSTDT